MTETEVFQHVANGVLATPIREHASGVLSRAFQHDPLFTCLLPSQERRRQALPHLFAPLLRDVAKRGGVLTMPYAVLTWLPVQQLQANLFAHIFRGYLSVPFHLGIRATLRLMAHEDWCNERIASYGSTEAAYIQAVGVEPDRAGQGLGSRLVDHALSRIAMTHRSCILRTEQPRNVPFYQKLGFRCVEHVDRPESGIQTWFFRRELPR